MTHDQIRARITEEAKSWLKTPFHHEGRVKGAGVDCGMLILEVYERVGLIPHVVPPHYGPDFMLHRREEWYVEFILVYANEIFTPPFLPGDAVVMKHGRIFSHGGIIIEWPMIVHASVQDRGVAWGDLGRLPLSEKKRRFFRHKELA